MGDVVKQESCQCNVERISEKSVTCEGKTVITKNTERKVFSGEAALIVANEEAAATQRESQAKCESIKTIGVAAGIGALVGTAFAVTSFLNNSSAPASGKAVSSDVKVSGDDDISGKTGGTV